METKAERNKKKVKEKERKENQKANTKNQKLVKRILQGTEKCSSTEEPAHMATTEHARTSTSSPFILTGK